MRVNRSPTSCLDGKVPAHLWYGEVPKYKKLRIFGCAAYSKIPKELLHGKLETRTEKCLFMGYCTSGYRLWSLDKSQIVFGHDVIFDESKFEHEATTTEYWLPGNEEISKDAIKLSKTTINKET